MHTIKVKDLTENEKKVADVAREARLADKRSDQRRVALTGINERSYGKN